MRAPALIVTAALLLGAAGPDSAIDHAIAGRVAGTPVRCIDKPSNQGPEIIDSATIIYRDGGRLWVNHLPARCPSLSNNVILIVDVYGGQLCHDDRFRTLERETSIPSGYCRLGDFTPYDRPPRPH
ncbi:hypothetical protein ACLB0R_03445 [Sphingomonas sp. GlSt437]|uniref:hypothetical protein n=1 Tax=Sphingomonas sp. GlSt437 TaxID=3389970 RepID=UPI003A87DDB0